MARRSGGEPAASRRVVIGSADAAVALQIRMILRTIGVATEWARDAPALAEALRGVTAHVVIIDAELDSDGIAVMERLGAAGRRARCGWVVVTDADDAASRQRALDAGAAACLSRQCYPREVRASVSRLIGA